MAWSAAIAALPTVIESISKIISSINDLSKQKKPNPQDLAKQNIELSKALGDLKKSVGKIGIAIRDYEDIYTATLKEETTAKALTAQFSIWSKDPKRDKDPSILDGFKALQNLDSDLKKSVNAHTRTIEKDDLDRINTIRNDIKDSFTKAEQHLSVNTNDSWKEAFSNINDICNKLGEIYSLLQERFEDMSTTLIGIKP